MRIGFLMILGLLVGCTSYSEQEAILAAQAPQTHYTGPVTAVPELSECVTSRVANNPNNPLASLGTHRLQLTGMLVTEVYKGYRLLGVPPERVVRYHWEDTSNKQTYPVPDKNNLVGVVLNIDASGVSVQAPHGWMTQPPDFNATCASIASSVEYIVQHAHRMG